MTETGTASTAAQADPTAEGKKADGAGSKDPVVSGLSKRLNEEIEARAAAEARAAELAMKAEEADTLRRENAAMKKTRQYTDVAPALEKLFEKGVDPDKVDDEFVAALRLGAKGPAPEAQGEIETPTHNAPRATGTFDPAKAIKEMSSEEFWGDAS